VEIRQVRVRDSWQDKHPGSEIDEDAVGHPSSKAVPGHPESEGLNTRHHPTVSPGEVDYRFECVTHLANVPDRGEECQSPVNIS